MTMIAMALPILPGKADRLRAFTIDLMGPHREEFLAPYRALGVRQRVFLQSGPQGDISIVTFEGDELQANLPKIVEAMGRDHFEQLKEIHGFDPSAGGAPPELLLDTGAR